MPTSKWLLLAGFCLFSPPASARQWPVTNDRYRTISDVLNVHCGSGDGGSPPFSSELETPPCARGQTAARLLAWLLTVYSWSPTNIAALASNSQSSPFGSSSKEADPAGSATTKLRVMQSA